jgi:glucose uptake protein GlcU
MKLQTTRKNMKTMRFTILLPVCVILLTSALWFKARSESRHATLDRVPIPLQLAGMLNAPVVLVAYPFYPFVEGDASPLRLAIFLIAVAFQWGYIGRVIDTRKNPPQQRTISRRTVGALGILFALAGLIVSHKLLYHVGYLYRAAALAWLLLMARHFFGLVRDARPAQSLTT